MSDQSLHCLINIHVRIINNNDQGLHCLINVRLNKQFLIMVYAD